MRIAQVAPLHESVPPRLYGGTERVVSYLAEELVALGEDVTLFATADSRTRARLMPVTDTGLRLDPDVRDPLAPHVILLDQVAALAGEFDVVHFHVGYLHFPLARRIGVPHVTTLHGRLDFPDYVRVLRHFRDLPLVSISDSQRAPVEDANWRATVYNGIPAELYHFQPQPGDYLAFLGRLSPEKRPDRAIEIAVRAGMPLKIAAKVDPADESYFHDRVEPLLSHPLVEYVGEISDQDKDAFLGGAYALVFPIDWPEPFGLVVIEALACGTPVIAYPGGAVREIMRDGVTGFIVEDIDEAVAAVGRVGQLDRAACRREFEARFSARRMAEDYLRVYHDALAQGAGQALAV